MTATFLSFLYTSLGHIVIYYAQMSTIVNELCTAFQDERGEVDLAQILRYMTEAQPRLQASSQLIMIKLRQIVQERPSLKVSQTQLVQILDMSLNNEQNFQLVFGQLSREEYIDFEQLNALNGRLNLGLTRSQMQGMIKSVSGKERVSKEELYRFLKGKQ